MASGAATGVMSVVRCCFAKVPRVLRGETDDIATFEDGCSSRKKTIARPVRQAEHWRVKRKNQSRITWVEVKSPRGNYQLFRRHISLALGGKKDIGDWGGGHPFDLELTRVPPGKTNWPYHAHSAQWELYVIISGQGMARTQEGETKIGPGDCFIHPPGDPHQIRNSGAEDLVYYVITDNPQCDVTSYPDSGKWFVKPQRKAFEMREVDYYKGEE